MELELTDAEKRMVKAIRRLSKKLKHVNPTHSQIGRELGITQWGATKTIHRIVEKKRAINPSNQKRSLELTPLGWNEEL